MDKCKYDLSLLRISWQLCPLFKAVSRAPASLIRLCTLSPRLHRMQRAHTTMYDNRSTKKSIITARAKEAKWVDNERLAGSSTAEVTDCCQHVDGID